jgi:pimeloyl-ACP methyl ester carboxylesterase
MRLILVHGYLAPTALLWPLGRRLAARGHVVEYFDYPSRVPPFDRHAESLARRLVDVAGPVGLIGHSMGGLLVHRAVATTPGTEVCAQIFLATPHRGAAAVRRLAALPFAWRFATGLPPGAAGLEVAPPAHGAVGTIAGLRDVMVRPHEATLPFPSPCLTLPYGHNELVLRARTADAIARFLDTGGFD